MKVLKFTFASLLLWGCSDFEFGPYDGPGITTDMKGRIIKPINTCYPAMMVTIELLPYSDTVCASILKDSFRIPGQEIIFDMRKRTGQNYIIGCNDTIPEIISVFNMRYPEEP